MRRFTLHVTTAAALITAPLLLPSTAHATGAMSGLIADFGVTQTWQGGFSGSYTITNDTRATVNTWSLTFSLPAGETVTSAWNGTLSQSGSNYTITSPSWATPLAPGASADVVGLDISSGATQTDPANCLINNEPCQGLPADTTPPSTPTGLAVSGTGPGSISLSWKAATDNVGVTGYNVYEGSSVVATVTGTTANITGLLAGSSHTFDVTAFDAAGNESPASATVTGVAGSGTLPGVAAPYVDMGAYPTPSLPAITAATGLKQLSLAFVINGSTPCTASWFGDYNVSTGWDKADIQAIQAAGGDVRVSFGGANGTELAQSCTTEAALAAQYQSVVDTYGLDRIDFDIEGSALADHTSIDLRSAAIAQVQAAQRAKGRDLRVSLTLPVLPSGLTADGVYALQSAEKAGVVVDAVNVMTMDFGDSTAPNPAGQMGTYSIDAAQATQAQIKSVWTSLTDAQAWAMVGVTPMLGQNDQTDEVFGLADAQQLITFAEQKHLGELSFWEVTRDANACTGGLSECTNIAQTPYEFSKMFAGYTG
ncbi:cellulose binding domain-containing protein [Streptacidiphilus sp. P02-A3a]|uniref:cellulose binding domain-containing protein n=1 Tax=Streptacidiphilus sp. P02-A3a TaxID=2704468 RepID=UPI0015F996B7|nr:cellulose binding domain-containing protein [Streptacidiphilus sp. P02-A3a]QMU70686.1 cellulose-binding protein [Streptacidiphilus sp. P02-A3a]